MDRTVICRKCPYRLPCDKLGCSLPFCIYEFKYDQHGGRVKTQMQMKNTNPDKKRG
jgi:hypothetical protein